MKSKISLTPTLKHFCSNSLMPSSLSKSPSRISVTSLHQTICDTVNTTLNTHRYTQMKKNEWPCRTLKKTQKNTQIFLLKEMSLSTFCTEEVQSRRNVAVVVGTVKGKQRALSLDISTVIGYSLWVDNGSCSWIFSAFNLVQHMSYFKLESKITCDLAAQCSLFNNSF